MAEQAYEESANEVLHAHLPRDALRIDHLLEHVNHVKELAMNITNDDDWFFHAQHVWLLAYKSQQASSVNQVSSN